MTEQQKFLMYSTLALVETIIRDCEAGTAPLEDVWWMAHTEKSGVHETIYERALDIRKRLYEEGITQ